MQGCRGLDDCHPRFSAAPLTLAADGAVHRRHTDGTADSSDQGQDRDEGSDRQQAEQDVADGEARTTGVTDDSR